MRTDTKELRMKLSSLQVREIGLQRTVDAEETLVCERGSGSKARLKCLRKDLSECKREISEIMLILNHRRETKANQPKRIGHSNKDRSFWDRLQLRDAFDRF